MRFPPSHIVLLCLPILAGCSATSSGTASFIDDDAQRVQTPVASMSIQTLSGDDARTILFDAEHATSRMPVRVRATFQINANWLRPLIAAATADRPSLMRLWARQGSVHGSATIRRRGIGDDSTANGHIMSGWVSVPFKLSTGNNELSITTGGRTRRLGSANGISLDLGREYLEHRDLWQFVRGRCTLDHQTCRIRTRIPSAALRSHIAQEPPGPLRQLFDETAAVTYVATISDRRMIAGRLSAVDSHGSSLAVYTESYELTRSAS